MILGHNLRTVDKADATMAAVNEQRSVADEIADIISNPVYGGQDALDDVSLN
jgi:charged multivesicular body protein 4A/B